MSIVPIDDGRRADGPRQPGRVPPHSIGAEQSVLGAMLMSGPAIDDVAEIVSPDDFYKPAHSHIYDAILRLHQRGEPADPVTVTDQLRADGQLDNIGGPSTLVTLQAGTPAISNARSYARTVETTATLRRLIAVAGEIAEIGYSIPDDVNAAVDRCETMLFGVTDRRVADDTMTLGDMLRQGLERLEERAEHPGPAGVTSGLVDVDNVVGGFVPASLNIVGARPGMGKTDLGIHIAAHIARHHQRPVYFLSAEMSHDQVTDRAIALAGNVSRTRIRSGQLLEADWHRIVTGVAAWGDLPVTVRSAGGATVASIRGAVRRITARRGQPPAIIVDYLQLLKATRSNENRQVEVAECARGLKELAVDLRTEVFAMAQINRGVEHRGDKRPTMADLRESGEIEAAADTVCLLYRDENYNPQSADRGTTEISVAKNRHGPANETVRVAYAAHTGAFANLQRM